MGQGAWPFRVDVVDWAMTRESFRRTIEGSSIVLRREPVPSF